MNKQSLLSVAKSTRTSGKGMFIVIEGFDGSGKSTCLNYILERLKEAGKPYVGVNGFNPKNPDFKTTELAKACADLVFKGDINPETELLLVQAARTDLYHKVIKPNLEEGTWVICDRWTPSTYVYQGVAKKLGEWKVSRVVDELTPVDLLLHIDTDFETCLQRINDRKKDVFEQQSLNVLKEIWDAYRGPLLNKFNRSRFDISGKEMLEMTGQIDWVLENILV